MTGIELCNGRLRTIKELGSGSEATAYLAFDDLLQRTVVARLVRSASYNDDARKQFEILARCRLPALVAPLGFLIDDGGRAVVVEEFVEGKTFEDWRRTALFHELLVALADIAEVLTALRKLGGQHGDLAGGENIMIREGRPVLIDVDATLWGSAYRDVPGISLDDHEGFRRLVQHAIGSDGVAALANAWSPSITTDEAVGVLRTAALRPDLRIRGPGISIGARFATRAAENKAEFLRLAQRRHDAIRWLIVDGFLARFERLASQAVSFNAYMERPGIDAGSARKTVLAGLEQAITEELASAAKGTSFLRGARVRFYVHEGARNLTVDINNQSDPQFERPWPEALRSRGLLADGQMLVANVVPVLTLADDVVPRWTVSRAPPALSGLVDENWFDHVFEMLLE